MSAVRDNPTEHRFELPIDDSSEIAAVYYRIEGGRLVLTHLWPDADPNQPQKRMGRDDEVATPAVVRPPDPSRKAPHDPDPRAR